MRNEELYNYLTGLCKKRSLPIEGLPKLFGFSRSSLYRYMTGIVRMSTEVQAKFVRILRLEDAERQEFERLVGLSQFDSSMIAARYAFDNFVFGKRAEPAEPKIFKFAYHESDTFLRTSDEIYALIQSLSLQPGASCTIRMINCLGKDIFNSVSLFIKNILSASENVTVEHLLAFSEKEHLQNINTFISIIPLLKYQSYSVHYGTKFTFHNTIDFYGNKFIIDVKLKDNTDRYFFISFHDDDLSNCLATSDKNVFTFWSTNYDYFKKSHDSSILDSSSIDIYATNLLELQQNHNHYLLKPNFCYDDIPMSVYQSMLTRGSTQELADVQNGLACAAGGNTGALATVFSILEKRIATTYINCRMNVHSMDGLTELARTGRLSDHFAFMPSFNKQELRTILEYVRDRNSDPNDSYTLFITKEKILANGHIMLVFEHTGVMIEYSEDDYLRGVCSNLFIRNSMLASIFTDYVKNHVPNNHALSLDEATAFLNSLIASLE